MTKKLPLLALGLAIGFGSLHAVSPSEKLDELLSKENADEELKALAPLIEDLAFLRKVSVDLIGRIPTMAEVRQFQAWPFPNAASLRWTNC